MIEFTTKKLFGIHLLKEPKATKNNLSKSKSRLNRSVDCDLLSQEDLLGSQGSSNTDKKSPASADRYLAPILKPKRPASASKAKEE